ncbi:MAG: S8 family serine peptidase [Bacilli bacterium]
MNIQGTSFATPIVSSVAALMHSYSVDKEMRDDSRDARLIKAVLMNSADKIAGWDNGSKRETVRVGDVDYANVLSTKQALDFKSGAGALNAEAALQAYDQFGTTSFLESVEFENSSYFDFHTDLTQFEFSATLCWYIGTVVDNVTYTETTIVMSTIHQINEVSADNSYFANLDLRLWQFDGESYVLLAESVSEYNNVEHIFMELSEAGDYRLEVAFSEMLYGTTPNETFALAYNLAQIRIQ